MTCLNSSTCPALSDAPRERRWLLLHGPAMALLVAVAALSGCSTLGSVAKVVAASTADAFSGAPSASYLDWAGMTVIAQPEANQNSPVALDLVFVRDAATLEKLSALQAARWFASRQDLQKTYPEGFSVRSWELVPRQVLQLTEEQLGSPRVAGVLIFADYLSPGEHRALLPNVRNGFMVDLGATGFTAVARAR